ncbi:MAG: hypothetical protein JRM86_01405 [Nitrososphaerota archaeon]|nr:hypothetical protein [Nitrososphaerota archaeon]MDG6979458.1 hypothetical protein [Nitrososphaerota archaeon]MDG7005572.1 hypothetical protein [Nitrososphaerota archaeon]
MYPELYPEFEGRNRKLKGFALSLAGSFVFMVTTFASIALSSEWTYLAVSGLSLGAVLLIFAAHRSRSFLSQVTFLIAASATLAAEAGFVGLFFPVPLAEACSILTLVGCLVAARGIHDVESMAALDPFSVKRRREITVEQQSGGE